MAEDWISLREFARRRDVRLSAVQKAIDTRRVTVVKRNARGRLVAIEANAATAQWNANTDPGEAAKSGKVLGAEYPPREDGGLLGESAPNAAQGSAAANTDLLAAVGPGAADAGDMPAGAGSSGKDPHGYQAARARREAAQANQAEVDFQKSIGELISAADQRQVSARRYRAMRDRLLNIPDRISAQLAAERDQARVHAALTAEIKRVLHELSNDAHAESERGVADAAAVGVAA